MVTIRHEDRDTSHESLASSPVRTHGREISLPRRGPSRCSQSNINAPGKQNTLLDSAGLPIQGLCLRARHQRISHRSQLHGSSSVR